MHGWLRQAKVSRRGEIAACLYLETRLREKNSAAYTIVTLLRRLETRLHGPAPEHFRLCIRLQLKMKLQQWNSYSQHSNIPMYISYSQRQYMLSQDFSPT